MIIKTNNDSFEISEDDFNILNNNTGIIKQHIGINKDYFCEEEIIYLLFEIVNKKNIKLYLEYLKFKKEINNNERNILIELSKILIDDKTYIDLYYLYDFDPLKLKNIDFKFIAKHKNLENKNINLILDYSIEKNNIEVFDLFLKKCPLLSDYSLLIKNTNDKSENFNIENKNRKRALSFAIENQHETIAELLLENMK